MIKYDVVRIVSTDENGISTFERMRVQALEFDQLGASRCKAVKQHGDLESVVVDLRREHGTLIQNTDCFDSEAKEIFEGDLLKLEAEIYEVVRVNGSMGYVKEKIDCEEFVVLNDSFTRQCKVIGNTVENPLLNIPNIDETLTNLAADNQKQDEAHA